MSHLAECGVSVHGQPLGSPETMALYHTFHSPENTSRPSANRAFAFLNLVLHHKANPSQLVKITDGDESILVPCFLLALLDKLNANIVVWALECVPHWEIDHTMYLSFVERFKDKIDTSLCDLVAYRLGFA
jgi:hypothetical protein